MSLCGECAASGRGCCETPKGERIGLCQSDIERISARTGLLPREFVEICDPHPDLPATYARNLLQSAIGPKIAVIKNNDPTRCRFLAPDGSDHKGCLLGRNRPLGCSAAPLIQLRLGVLGSLYGRDRCLVAAHAGIDEAFVEITPAQVDGLAEGLGITPKAARDAAGRFWYGR